MAMKRQKRSQSGSAAGPPSLTASSVETPAITADHVVMCRSSNGLRAERKYEVVQDKKVGDDFRVYAGMRADPFFFNAAFATDAIAGKLDPPKDSNTMKGANILAIVMEI